MSFGEPELVTAGPMAIGAPEVLVLLIGAAVVIGAIKVVRKMKEGSLVGFAGAGAFVGALLGFLFRPSVPLIGQLPLGTVLSRGSNLSGMDMILRPVAEESFNYVIIGAILCAAIMAGVRYMMLQNAASPATVPASPSPTPQPIAAAATAPGGNPFCTACGTPLPDGIMFCGKCGTKRG